MNMGERRGSVGAAGLCGRGTAAVWVLPVGTFLRVFCPSASKAATAAAKLLEGACALLEVVPLLLLLVVGLKSKVPEVASLAAATARLKASRELAEVAVVPESVLLTAVRAKEPAAAPAAAAPAPTPPPLAKAAAKSKLLSGSSLLALLLLLLLL